MIEQGNRPLAFEDHAGHSACSHVASCVDTLDLFKILDFRYIIGIADAGTVLKIEVTSDITEFIYNSNELNLLKIYKKNKMEEMSTEQTSNYTLSLVSSFSSTCHLSVPLIYIIFYPTLGIAGLLSFSTLLLIPCYRQLRQRRFMFQFNIVLADFITTIGITVVNIVYSEENSQV